MKFHGIGTVLLIVGVLMTLHISGQTSGSVRDEATDGTALTQVLREIRQLKADLVKEHLTFFRAQLLLERERAQRQRVASLEDRLETLRAELDAMRSHLPELQTRTKDTEDRLHATRDVTQRIQLEGELKDLKSMLEVQLSDLQQHEAREQESATQLLYEQSELDKLTTEIQKLQSDMETQLGADPIRMP